MVQHQEGLCVAHLAGEGDLCIVGVAQQLSLLLAQSQCLLYQRRVVGLA